MKNVIFTITANDFFSQSITLMQSILSNGLIEDSDEIIFIADKRNSLVDYYSYPFKVVFVDDVFKDRKIVEECRFKYNVVEYNVMLKPFLALYLIEKYTNVLYFDSDIFVYSSLMSIVNKLEKFDMVLTPHYNSVLCNNVSSTEIECIRCGFFNLGFFAVNNSFISKEILSTWANRLLDYCFMDRFSLYVDQKWMDSIFCLFHENIYVLKNDSVNVALWNLFERKIVSKKGVFYVSNRFSSNEIQKLTFFHFSGINLKFTDLSNLLDMRKQEKKTLQFIDNDVLLLLQEYIRRLNENKFLEYYSIPYAFDYFDNGIRISSLNRAIFNKIILNDPKFVSSNPFSSDSFFYLLLKRNHLLQKKERKAQKPINKIELARKKGKIINSFFNFIKQIIGEKKFLLLNKYLNHISEQDNMDYLLKRRKK